MRPFYRQVTGALALFCLVPALALAQGAGGDPRDRLDWPGSPTDRYLEADEIRDVLHAATDDFYTCFRQEVRGGAVANEVSVEFAVERSGKAVDILPELGDAPLALGPCLIEVVGGLDFGAHDGDSFEAAYPLVYQVDRKGARILPYPIVFTRPKSLRLPLLVLPPDLRPGELLLLEKVFVLDEPSSESEAIPPAEEPPKEAENSPSPDSERP